MWVLKSLSSLNFWWKLPKNKILQWTMVVMNINSDQILWNKVKVSEEAFSSGSGKSKSSFLSGKFSDKNGQKKAENTETPVAI